MAVPARELLSPEEYLARERSSDEKHEFFGGRLFPMAGASPAHNLIVANLIRRLGNALQDSPCVAFPSDLRVKVSATGLYTYPDVVVVCGEIQLEGGDTLLNPTLIVEVLSPGTESYDRGVKFAHYRQAASLQEYVLVPQDRVLVEQFVRRGEQWVLTALDGVDATLALSSVPAAIPVAQIYDRVELPPAPGR